MKRLTHMQRAERWYAQQVKNNNLRNADYSALARKMSLCYEPAVMLNNRQNVTDQDMKQQAKLLNAVQNFKLS